MTPTPLFVPLSFPQIFQPWVTSGGLVDVSRRVAMQVPPLHQGSTGPQTSLPPPDVEESSEVDVVRCPAATSLVATKAFGPRLTSVSAKLNQVSRKGLGKDILSRWGMEALEVSELVEVVQQAANKYDDLSGDEDDLAW